MTCSFPPVDPRYNMFAPGDSFICPFGYLTVLVSITSETATFINDEGMFTWPIEKLKMITAKHSSWKRHESLQ